MTPRNYYLWIEGKEHGPYDEPQLKAAVTGGDIDPNTLGRLETGTHWTPLRELLRLPKPKPASVHVAPIIAAAADSKEEYLRKLRERSCYGALRTVINIAALLSCAGLALTAIMQIGASLKLGEMTMGLLLSVGTAAIGLLLIIAFRQASILLIDIGDTLLERNARKE